MPLTKQNKTNKAWTCKSGCEYHIAALSHNHVYEIQDTSTAVQTKPLGKVHFIIAWGGGFIRTLAESIFWRTNSIDYLWVLPPLLRLLAGRICPRLVPRGGMGGADPPTPRTVMGLVMNMRIGRMKLTVTIALLFQNR